MRFRHLYLTSVLDWGCLALLLASAALGILTGVAGVLLARAEA
jgi:hypothetical protein